jgi:hypothetical protein
VEDIPELIVQSPWMHRLREALDDEQSDTLIVRPPYPNFSLLITRLFSLYLSFI